MNATSKANIILKHAWLQRSLFAALVMTGSLLAGCSGSSLPTAADEANLDTPTQANARLELQEEPNAHEAQNAEIPPALATIELETGTTVEFIDLGEGQVGLLEHGTSGLAHVATSLAETHDATALEVFLAVAPNGTEVPEALVKAHEAQVAAAGKQSAPRQLSVETATGGLFDPNIACGAAWPTDWVNHFKNITKYEAALYFTDYNLMNYKYFYAGSTPNYKTYLGVCSVYATAPLVFNIVEFQVQRQYIINGVSMWIPVLDTDVYGGQTYTFYHGGSPYKRFRGRIRAYNGGASPSGFYPLRDFGIGAAWTKTAGFQIEL